jgi:hypothetical protein
VDSDVESGRTMVATTRRPSRGYSLGKV